MLLGAAKRLIGLWESKSKLQVNSDFGVATKDWGCDGRVTENCDGTDFEAAVSQSVEE